jgi:hypothetical protein
MDSDQKIHVDYEPVWYNFGVKSVYHSISKIMKKICTIFGLSLLVAFSIARASCQSVIIQPLPGIVTDNKGEKYFMEPFHNGLARITRMGNWGMVDTVGKFIIPMVYDELGLFYNNRAIVSSNGFYGVIDKQNNLIVQPKYDYISDYANNVAIINLYGLEGLIDHTGNELVPLKYNEIEHLVNGFYHAKAYHIDGTAALLDSKGKVVLKESELIIRSFSDGNVFVLEQGEWPAKLLRSDGTEMAAINAVIEQYSSDMGIIGDDDIDQINANAYIIRLDDDKEGVVDSLGRLIKPFVYDFINVFDKGYVCFYKDNKCELWDNGLTHLISGKYERFYVPDSYDTFEGINQLSISTTIPYVKYQRNGKWGLLSCSGKEVTQPVYDDIYHGDYGYIIVRNNNQHGLIDTTGKEVFPTAYDNITLISPDLIALSKQGKIQYRNREGKIIAQLDGIMELAFKSPIEGLLYFSDGSRHTGCVDMKGNVIVQPTCFRLKFSASGMAEACQEVGKCGYLDATGELMLPYIYNVGGNFVNGKAEVYQSQSMRTFYINKKGIEVKE